MPLYAFPKQDVYKRQILFLLMKNQEGYFPLIRSTKTSDMPDMHCHCIICCNCFLIPDVFVDLINGCLLYTSSCSRCFCVLFFTFALCVFCLA